MSFLCIFHLKNSKNPQNHLTFFFTFVKISDNLRFFVSKNKWQFDFSGGGVKLPDFGGVGKITYRPFFMCFWEFCPNPSFFTNLRTQKNAEYSSPTTIASSYSPKNVDRTQRNFVSIHKTKLDLRVGSLPKLNFFLFYLILFYLKTIFMLQ